MKELLDEVYSGEDRVSRDEIHRRAVAGRYPDAMVAALRALPDGEYAQAEVLAVMGGADGVPPAELSDADLVRQLESLHRTRHDTLLHGSAQALAEHSARTREMEAEYLRRHPDREVDPERLRSGARHRG